MENSNSNKKKKHYQKQSQTNQPHNQPTEWAVTQKHMLQNSCCNILFKVTGDFQALSRLDR